MLKYTSAENAGFKQLRGLQYMSGFQCVCMCVYFSMCFIFLTSLFECKFVFFSTS